MDPILVYGHPAGSATGLVTALEWLGQPYRLCRVDMLVDMKTEAYARLNGRRETPVLVTDDGRILTETMAIALWIEARDVHRRISFEPRTPEADRMHQLVAFINTSFTGAFSPLWAALEMRPPRPGAQEVLRDVGRKAVAKRHAQLEAMLLASPWLVGDAPSLADGVLAGVARWNELHEVVSIGDYPRLATVRRRIESDPAFVLASSIEAGDTTSRPHLPLADVLARFAPDR